MNKLEGAGIGLGCVVGLVVISILFGTLGLAFMGAFKFLGWWAIPLCVIMRQFTPQIVFGVFVSACSAYYLYEYLEWGVILTILVSLVALPIGMAASQEGQNLWKKDRGLS